MMKENIPRETDPSVSANTEKVLANQEKVKELLEQLGYSSVETLEGLGLSQDQLKEIRFVNLEADGVSFFKTSRADGAEVKAITRTYPTRYIAADIFSLAYYKGHGGNDDFNWDELKGSLETAKSAKPYPAEKK